MENLTYQEILAQQYRENEELEEQEEEHFENNEIEVRDTQPDEIEDKDGYNKPGRNFGDSIIQKPPAVYEDKTTAGVKYLAKDIYRRVINIDSRFRENPTTTSTTDFLFKLHTPLKNVTSMTLSSIEFPNTSYVFSIQKRNISFKVSFPESTPFRTVTIPEGSYDDPSTLTGAVQTALNSQISSDLQVSLSLVTGKVSISSITSTRFSLDFTTVYNEVKTTGNPPVKSLTPENRSFDTGLGYNLGFRGILDPVTGIRNQLYSGDDSYTSEAIVISIDSNYVFLSLGNDFPVITHQYNTYDHINAFAKVFLNVPSFNVVFDNGSTTITQAFVFKKPTNIRSLRVKVYDVYGQIVDTNGIDFSFTLEVDEVISNSLYHTLTEGT
jgi:hypothetical protein